MGKPRSGIQVSIYNTPGNEQCGPTSCARVITRDTKRMHDICEYISECSSVTSADIKGVLEALTSYIGRELSYGYSVELEGLGHFSPSVKSKEVTDQKGNTKSSASIHGVNFRCSPRLKEMVKKNVYEAALDLGATPFQALRKVILPEILPGMISGFILAFTLSIDDFAVTIFTIGNEGLETLSTYIYADARKGGLTPELRPLSTLIFITVLVLLIVINKRAERARKK